MAYLNNSIEALCFTALKVTPGVGPTFLSDNTEATKYILGLPLGQKLKRLGLCYVRKLTDREFFKGKDESGVYNHWQTSFMTEDPKEAERIATESGLKVEWGPNRFMKTKC